MTETAVEALDLLDWRRRIGDSYALVRRAGGGAQAWTRWRGVRDELIRTHPQSPVPAPRRGRVAPAWFDHDPACRVVAALAPGSGEHRIVAGSTGQDFGMTRVAVAQATLRGEAVALDVYWLDGYGGGLFVPFTDATSGHETYGGGRYLIDTVKGADLGMHGDRLVLDFNFAYHPSCAYDPRWACPLAPPGNRLTVAVRAGESLPQG